MSRLLENCVLWPSEEITSCVCVSLCVHACLFLTLTWWVMQISRIPFCSAFTKQVFGVHDRIRSIEMIAVQNLWQKMYIIRYITGSANCLHGWFWKQHLGSILKNRRPDSPKFVNRASPHHLWCVCEYVSSKNNFCADPIITPPPKSFLRRKGL